MFVVRDETAIVLHEHPNARLLRLNIRREPCLKSRIAPLFAT